MKTIYFTRHAKSSWKFKDLKDSERPLKKKGIKNAEFIAKLLKKDNYAPELIISSPAVRAFETAKIFADKLGMNPESIIKEKKLYMADYENFIDVIQLIPEQNNSVMIFSHNPGLTYTVSTLSTTDIDNVPTSGVVRIDFDIQSWRDIKSADGKLVLFEFPKKYEIE